MATQDAPAAANALLMAVFRKARPAIEAWVDDEKNRECMLRNGPEELRQNPEIQAILQAYATYSSEMGDRLLRHLDFMVDNRRKFYRAQGQRRQ